MFPLLRNQLESIEHKKPDIHVVNHLEKKCFIVEITVCYDLCLEYARNTKYEKSINRWLNIYREMDMTSNC